MLMNKESGNTEKPHSAATQDSSFGFLSRYANPTFWPRESDAWERAAIKKHETVNAAAAPPDA